MRKTLRLDHDWFFARGEDPAWLEPDFPAEAWKRLSIPATNLELPWNGFDEKSYQFVSTWLRDIELGGDGPLPSLGDLGARGRAFVDFEGVMTKARVYLNGLLVGSHSGGFTPFSLELGSLLRPGMNRLALVVDSRELPEVPPFGHVVDYLCYGGIYREAFFRLQDEVYISSIFARPGAALLPKKRLEVEVSLDAKPGLEGKFEIEVVLLPSGAEAKTPLASARIKVDPAEGRATALLEDIEGVAIWEPADPRLYRVRLTLFREGLAIDEDETRVGFREARWMPEGFFLNGKRLKIRGLNRHQAWPYLGYAMPERAQRRDAEILKRELGLNLVRSSHYPPSRHFLDACDELGLLVFEELPGWQHIGDETWKRGALQALEEMILRDRNHPSIVLWGVRVNESRDDHDFYQRTNALARRLDPTRQTGGVRYLRKSKFLEDVYTFNDFVHSGGARVLRKPRSVTGSRRPLPYLVTEHNGHMFPVKRYDQEERLAEQALRHARVLDAALGDEGMAGAIGWCAFDYNTHKDFGSGDRVCYHGVSDQGRVPKYAAAVYASQVEGSERLVLEAATLFAKGERGGAALLPIQIWTNCDDIVLFRGGERIGVYRPDRRSFPNLPHPPIVIEDLVGERLEGRGFSRGQRRLIRRLVSVIFSKGFEALKWHELLRMALLLFMKRMSYADGEKLISGFALGWGSSDEIFEIVGRVGGLEVTRRRYGGDARAERLVMEADDAELRADGIDLTRVVLRLLDQYGNLHPFGAEAVELSIEGPGSLVGPRLLPLLGGVATFWVRAGREEGGLRVLARGGRFEAKPLRISIAKAPRP